ncbi:MAG: amidohydrolase family protein [Bacteroidia bacterium]
MKLNKPYFLVFSIGLFVLPCMAQKKKSDSKKDESIWNVNSPTGPTKSHSFELTEGTWMNLDLSPDGTQIVFDLLGDVYIMPSSGGEARCLRSGAAFEVQPRFSPDGKSISFTSDAGGADNIWVMDLQGQNARQITKEDYRLLNNAIWTPDGNYIIARKHFTSTRSAGAGELWMYSTQGGSGMQLTKRKNDQQDLGEPFITKDGRYVYFSEDVYPGGYFQYNKDPNSLIYAIKKLDRETGAITNVTAGPGGAVRPVLSHSNQHLAFVKRVRNKSVLFIRELASGKERALYTELSKDQQEAWAIFGVYTNFSWSPDDRFIYIWAQGKIRRIEVKTGTAEEIPFKLTARHTIADALRFKQKAATDSFNLNAIRNAVTSADGKTLFFNAAGYLWKKQLPSGKPVRITNTAEFEFEPALSADGKLLAFVAWSDTAMGQIRLFNLINNSVKTLALSKGIYRMPAFSPDGKTLVYLKEEGNDHQGFAYCAEPGFYTVNIDQPIPKALNVSGEFPQFSIDGQRIYYQTGGYLFGELEKAFKSCDLNGSDVRTHYTSKYVNRYVLSPDQQALAFTELFKLYVCPFIRNGQPLDINNGTDAYPVKLVSDDAGIYPHWSSNSGLLHWTLGGTYYTVDATQLLSADNTAKPTIIKSDIGLKLAHDKPEGIFVYSNAKIITMNGTTVINKGTIVVEGNRIIAIGEADKVTVPAAAKVMDCSGKTIIPGLVDVHAHLGTFRYGLSPQQQWQYFANLAFGVTTTHDPSSNTEMVFSQSEMVKAGYMTGPRIFSTGIILYGADGDFRAQINGLDDARFALKRTNAFGAFSVKSYNQPRRNQRQQVIQAAREQKMNVVPEGGSHFYHNMSMIIDGHTGIEHNIPVHDIYDDVKRLWSASGTGYTPTLIVSYGSVNGEYYYYQNEKVWENKRLLNFTPRALVDPRSRHRTMLPDDEYQSGHIRVSNSCKQLSDAGVKVNMGSHGQIQGLGAHWEIKMLGEGGMSAFEALRCATYNGAYYIGMEDEIGSLEKGKLADFLILDKNPAEDLTNLESLRYTVANGRLYDAFTIQEQLTGSRKRMPFYFEHENGSNDFKFHEETGCFQGHSCGCRK